jgi:membrane-bound inhibitor of C-type lysozyme
VGEDAQRLLEGARRHRVRAGRLPPAASARYQCPGPPPQEVVVDYLATDPPTAMVTYAGDAQFMRAAPSGSGARYRGGNRQFWEHQGVGLLVWDLRVGEVRCARP